jgi:hypothetical protein
MLIRTVPASSGALWVREGWRLFAKQPLALSAMVVAYMMILLVPALLPLPLVGIAISGVLAPFATVGLLAACREVDRRNMPTMALFAQPFRDPAARVQLLRLGLINAALLLLIASIATLLGPPVPAEPPKTLQEIPLDAIVLQLVLYVPVLMLMWFAPLLVGWHAMTPGKAMFGSVVACWLNKGALLLYALTASALMMAVSLVSVGLFSALVASREALSVLLAPVALLLMTIVQASFYAMYKSVFGSE